MTSRFTSQPNHGLWVVGLVASVDGLDALSQVLATLPPDFPAAIVALQHVRPEHRSRLAEILGRRTALTVQPAHDSASLRPGLVLVAPPAATPWSAPTSGSPSSTPGRRRRHGPRRTCC
jgi:chemotaxis response regulator CheB